MLSSQKIEIIKESFSNETLFLKIKSLAEIMDLRHKTHDIDVKDTIKVIDSFHRFCEYVKHNE